LLLSVKINGVSMMFCWRYLCTTLAVLLAISAGLVVRLSSVPKNLDIVLNDTSRHQFSISLLNDAQVETYRRDGVVLVTGLLDQEQVGKLRREALATTGQSWTLFDWLVSERYSKIAFDVWRTDLTCASLSLQNLPQLAAQLLPNNPQLRLLRDAFFAYTSGGKGCGWHVDDSGFWPTKEDTSGVTVWIALDEMRVSKGGGLAVANMSLAGEWVEHCRAEVRAKGTCDMEEKSPDCHAKLEDIKLQWDMKPGDAILWDRWTFHRTVPSIDASEGQTKSRYSIRYVPSDATAAGAIHPTVQKGSLLDSPYYPQVWPHLLDHETEALRQGLDSDVSVQRVLQGVLRVLLQIIRNKLPTGVL
jgi:hypothetical protein